MRLILSFLLAAIWPFGSFDSISQNNRARKEADNAFRAGDYKRAVQYYAFLIKQPAQTEAAIWLNLGHAYFALGQYGQANAAYQRFEPTETGPLLAVAYVQRSVIACAARDTSRALQLLQQALLIDPQNEPARYNFELVKSRFSGKKPPQPRQKPSAQPQAQRDSSGQELVRSPRQEQVLRRLRNLNMTEEQANLLLNAMRDDDVPLELARRRAGRKGGGRW
ncbi:hypothetical protein F5984_20415 [Rudanella paleaurantiibacter]|uniref:Tetratricopeptide repeat protein n=1 Tax=Rudanella paleaurantiibacter TaxID=2614655 RepID=A0A7J5TVE3_9BACT|nr:tetratricopeptide repeat protein [Rudanella paleaurantiibacter]KAB7728115.1 hypothetical protein F5984_20415 [Rudanella paleaurantiibacter]